MAPLVVIVLIVILAISFGFGLRGRLVPALFKHYRRHERDAPMALHALFTALGYSMESSVYRG